MMEELATVVAINQQTITLASDVKSSCSSCAQSDTCSSGQVAKAFPQKKLEFSLPFSAAQHSKIAIGDKVIIGLPEIDVLKSAWQVYLYPIIGLIAFSSISQWLQKTGAFTGAFSHELFALLIGITGGYLGYKLAKHRQTNTLTSLKLCPKIIRTVSV